MTTTGPFTASSTSNNKDTISNNRVASPPLNYDYSVITSDTEPAATLLLDAKNEYNKQLISHLRQPVFNLMKTIYNTSEDICHQENTPENVLMVFQDNLAQVPKWNKTRRTKEYNEFLKISSCDWFNELIKFCYITHVKILTIVNKPRPDIKLSISIPSGSAFFHSVCVAVARELWRSPFLFNKNVGGKYEYQKNMRLIEQIIDNSVDTCIRAHIPMKAILMEYLDNDVSVPNTVPNKQTTDQESKPQQPQHHQSVADKLHITETLTNIQPTQSNTKISTRISSQKYLKISDELDTFIDTPSDQSEQTNELELVNFTKPDELVDELEIIEPTLNDEYTAVNPTTHTNILDDATGGISDLSEVSLAPAMLQSPDILSNSSANQLSKEPTSSSLQPDTISVANQNGSQEISVMPSSADIMSNTENKTTKDEFDIDSLPEISLVSLTQIVEPTKPITQEPALSAHEPAPSAHEPSIDPSNIKHIPLTDMNEPGQYLATEIKQPMPKKKIIIEDLGIDDLDEVPLAAKIDEMNTFKKINTQQKTNQIITNKNEFAFF